MAALHKDFEHDGVGIHGEARRCGGGRWRKVEEGGDEPRMTLSVSLAVEEEPAVSQHQHQQKASLSLSLPPPPPPPPLQLQLSVHCGTSARLCLSIPGFAMDNSGKEKEAMQLMAEADKKVKASGSFLGGMFG
ncbi:Beta-soluble NSF attachment protein [Liparis tanakae]|uniref:Beta-soluble NSF attachment protein n=1 Tax=Liparis tanakae TaxID=230148 RepID=A0A4Z2HAG7_9TELE|nr:Beta-soluble NSF attachment protein [Liparis tanakae]